MRGDNGDGGEFHYEIIPPDPGANGTYSHGLNYCEIKLSYFVREALEGPLVLESLYIKHCYTHFPTPLVLLKPLYKSD